MSIKIILNDDRLWYRLFWSHVLIYTMSCHDLTWYNVSYFHSLCEVMWCDVICKYVLKLSQSFNCQCNYFLHYLYCINFFFIFLPYLPATCLPLSYLNLPYLTLPYLILPCLALSYLILSYLTLSYLFLSYLTLSYLTLSYLLWFNLAHLILFLSRFQLDLQMRIFLWIMTGYLLLIQPEENIENVSQ